MKPPTYRELLETAIRAEEIILERNTVEAKKKKTTGMFIPYSLFRTSRGSSYRGSRFQQDSFRGRGSSRPTQSTVSIFGRRFRRPPVNRRDRGRGRSISIVSASCNKCGKFHYGEYWGPRMIVCYY